MSEHAIRDRAAGGFAWREAGEPSDAAPILLLHGLTGSRLSWEPQLAGLVDRGTAVLATSRRVAAWDNPGYGDSARLPSTPSFGALADAVVRWADVLGAHMVHVVGLSFGGMIAQHTALVHPDRVASLTLLSTSPKFGLDGTKPDEWRAARLAALDRGLEPVDFAPDVLRSIAGPNISETALQGQVLAAARVPSGGLRDSIDVLITHDTRDLLRNIGAPTLCLVGEFDSETPIAYAEALSSGIPGSVLRVIAGAGHLLNVEAPNEVNTHVLRHITEVESASS